MKERKIKYPCIYRHFKGDFYATMGISIPCDVEKIDVLTFARCVKTTHTEEEKTIIVYIDSVGNMVHSNKLEASNMVIYKSLYDDSGIYARPYDMFASEIDKEKYPNYLTKYRFEEYEV